MARELKGPSRNDPSIGYLCTLTSCLQRVKGCNMVTGGHQALGIRNELTDSSGVSWHASCDCQPVMART